MRAHPRSRGENEGITGTTPRWWGSSPLTRGKRMPVCVSDNRFRLIPAHAGKTPQSDAQHQSCSAHPRSRGENLDAPDRAINTNGSSPLTRGKLPPVPVGRGRAGLIPAHAGKTPPWLGVTSWCTAHPRSRGENPDGRLRGGFRFGSSPLTRGKRRAARLHDRLGGLIPAHAGKTMTWWCQYGDLGAHPRSRGENRLPVGASRTTIGSSPLTRGKPGTIVAYAGVSRLIPAHAGKTAAFSEATRRARAHPRSRGENIVSRCELSHVTGSSPLTRGKPAIEPMSPSSRGLIPAHAGKTTYAELRIQTNGAHPRSRGENLFERERYARSMGSSPLTRGKPAVPSHDMAPARLIPAHAGKTPGAEHVGAVVPAHPRSRGENDPTSADLATRFGSSPLTRGKPVRLLVDPTRTRLIPAHAGKTARRNRPDERGPAHPRSRGENSVSVMTPSMSCGSSPLTRGKHFPTCAFTAQIDQILETLELAVSSGSYSVWVACATDAPQDQVRSIGLVLPSSRGAS